MEDIHSNLIIRLNYLIGLLDISSEDSFNKIKGHKALPAFESIGEIYNNQYLIYKNQITISALLLGYAHFEAFLTELMSLCLRKNPKLLLPEGKNQAKEKTVTYLNVINAGSYDSIIAELIEKEVRNIMYDSMPEILNYLDKKLKLQWNREYDAKMLITNQIRNCCMHNNCIANKSLAKDPMFIEGTPIELNAGDVHSFGLTARFFTRELWNSAKEKYGF